MTSSVATTWGDINGVWTTSDAENLPLAQVSLANGIRDLINGYQSNYSTVALLLAVTPAANSWATADNAPGARFQYVSGAWVMQGVPRFATAAARNSALTAPAAGWLSRIDTEKFTRIATGSGTTWVPWGTGSYSPQPTSVTGGTLSSSGSTITVAASSSLAVDGIFTSEFRKARISWSLTFSGAANLGINLRSGGSTNSSAVYDRQVLQGVNATAAAAQGLAGTSWPLSGLAGTHEGSMDITNAADAAFATSGAMRFTSTANPMTATAGLYGLAVLHRTLAAYDGIIFVPSTGTMTGWFAFEGLAA